MRGVSHGGLVHELRPIATSARAYLSACRTLLYRCYGGDKALYEWHVQASWCYESSGGLREVRADEIDCMRCLAMSQR